MRILEKLRFMPPTHAYCGHTGPWLERAFYAECKRLNIEFVRDYLVGYWTDFLAPGGIPLRQRGTRKRELVRFMAALPDEQLFTVVQHCDGFYCPWPKNLVVFGAGGTGDVPLPLLMPRLEPDHGRRTRKHRVTFMGRTAGPCDRTGVRQRMLNAFNDRPGFLKMPMANFRTYCDVIRQSDFVLCPRGYGLTSFRLYETLALGSVPVYVHNGKPWLPYEDQLHWDALAVIVHADELPELPDRLDDVSDARRQQMLDYARDVYAKYFTITGVVHWVQRQLRTHGSS